MADIIITNTATGEQARLLGRPWWIDGALEVRPGRIEVARADAESLTKRAASEADIAAGKAREYQSGEDLTGPLCRYIIGLTEEELDAHGLVPGELRWPEVVDGTRPKTNRVDRPVTMDQYNRAMDALQNEDY